MKHSIKVTAVVFVLTILSACTNGGKSPAPIPTVPIPDLSNFLVNATTAFAAGAQALIHIASSTLGDGTFTVNFMLSGSNNTTGTATLTMSGGVGTFNTPVLTSDGPTTVTITSISNSSGGSSSLTSGNTSSMFDSTGSMVANYTPHGASAQPFKATDVKASLAGTLLNIQGVVWTPDLKTINLYINSYSAATGVTYFNMNDLMPGDPTYTGNGSAHYGESGSSATIADISAHGSITISTVTPLLTGSFTYTNPDSSVVAGTFSCPHP